MKKQLLANGTGSVVVAVALLLGSNIEASEVVSDADINEGLMAVEAYIYSRPPSSDAMRLFDVKRNKKVVLRLETIHQKDFLTMSDGDFAICAEFQSQDNVPYMLWFVVGEKKTPDKYFYGGYIQDLKTDRTIVKDVFIHKVDGVARYAWTEKDGISRISAIPGSDSKHQHH